MSTRVRLTLVGLLLLMCLGVVLLMIGRKPELIAAGGMAVLAPFSVLSWMVARSRVESGNADVKLHADEVRSELAQLREEQQHAIDLLRERLATAKSQVETAIHDRERLMAEMREMTGAPADASASYVIEKAHEKIEAEMRRQAAKTKMVHSEATLVRSRSEVEELQKELSAAEELLRESDARSNELDQKLNDQNRELWKLKSEVAGAQSHARESRLKTMMLTKSHIKKGEHTLRLMEELIKRWIRASGKANVNFSTHGHASTVATAFERIDRDFVDRFFTHVTNPEYERGQHRVIRVKSGEDPDGGRFGELVISLDDDAGRTLGLRFDLRKDAPDAASVGFVLALLLKALTREYRDYGVIVK